MGNRKGVEEQSNDLYGRENKKSFKPIVANSLKGFFEIGENLSFTFRQEIAQVCRKF